MIDKGADFIKLKQNKIGKNLRFSFISIQTLKAKETFKKIKRKWDLALLTSFCAAFRLRLEG